MKNGNFSAIISPMRIDEIYMSEALKEARQAAREEEVPVGCVIVYRRKIIARAHNQVERLKDPTAHAEMLALTSATNYLGNKWLLAATIYATIEPCSMCAGAIVLSRAKRLVFGASDPKAGACGSVINLVQHHQLNHRIQIKKGVLKDKCAAWLSEFFQKKRRRKFKRCPT